MNPPSPLRAPWLALALLVATQSLAPALDLGFPTRNRALLQGDGAGFYMFVDRNFKGVKSTPWEGGQYGFVRDPKVVSAGTIYTRLHEGADIRPLERTAAGEPLDIVTAAAAGRVVHVNNAPRASNYGCYVVIEHQWNGCLYYSLYAHLSSTTVQIGQQVARGDALGRLGYTGDGIDRRRAHVHFEVNLLLSENFDEWHKLMFPADANVHGLYNGMNLAGMDVGRLLLAASKSPTLTIPEFLSAEAVTWSAVVPATDKFALAKLYPWMVRGDATGARAWKISFARSGLPLRIEPWREAVTAAAVVSVAPTAFPLAYVTKGYISGTPKSPVLTRKGQDFLRLVSGSF
jgi:murein DD-endopeptidase MepM/ murein hydrolase activator NlpD